MNFTFNEPLSTVNRLVFTNGEHSLIFNFDENPINVSEILEDNQTDMMDRGRGETEVLIKRLKELVLQDNNRRYSKKVLSNLESDPQNTQCLNAALRELYKQQKMKKNLEYREIQNCYSGVLRVAVSNDGDISDTSIIEAIVYRYETFKGWSTKEQVFKNQDFRKFRKTQRLSITGARSIVKGLRSF